MLARGLCRLAAEAPRTSTASGLPQLARLLQQAVAARHATPISYTSALSSVYKLARTESRRQYATTTVESTSEATAKPAAKRAPRKKVVKTTVTETTTTKAKAPKKTATKKKTKRTTAKKAKAKKAAPKKRVRLTEEQKVKKKETSAKLKVTELRKTALKEPVSGKKLGAWTAYLMEQRKAGGTGFVAYTPDLAAKYKNLSPAEKEHYNHLVNEMNSTRQAEYRAWIHQHTPEQIQAANRARAALRRMFRGTFKTRTTPAHTRKLVDDRKVKQPVKSPYILFFVERQESGDMKGIPNREATKLIAAEWTALGAGEKQRYIDSVASSRASSVESA